MSATRREAAAASAASGDGTPRIAAGAVLAGVTAVVAGVAAWPIYGAGGFVLLAVVCAVVGAGIAAVAQWRRWRGWSVAACLAGAVLLLGVPLAVPSRLGAPAEILRGLGEVLSGLVLGWKDLITVQPPVGTYRNLLVPALVVFLVGTCVVLRLAWRVDRVAYAAVPVALAMVSFGLFFGRASVSEPLRLGPVTLYAPVETAIGLIELVVCLLWLTARAHAERVRALQRAAASSGVRMSVRTTRTDRRRTALAASMLVGALLLAGAAVPYAARDADRDVLRSAIGPDIDLSAEPSPLSRYRSLFSDGADDVMFTVAAADGELPDRVRIATLDAYDGEVFRTGGDGAVDDGRFVRVPSTLDAGEGEQVAATITIREWDDVWMPTVGHLEDVDFGGDRATALTDRFYYSVSAAAGVQTAGGGLQSGDTYVVRGVEPASPALDAVRAPGGTASDIAIPDSLTTWVDEHASGADGAALAGLVDLIRSRGYLSHGLDKEAESTALWTAELSDYVFQPSASGHSLARIDSIFTRLLERETDTRAESTGNYVAAIGDDEQFAVVVALIARELGFPARIVLGARLASDDPDLPVCEAGVCRAQDLAAWAEVQGDDGAWVPIDATPQHAMTPSLDVTEQRDPENVTEVRPDTIEEVVPPDPSQEDSAADRTDDDVAGPDLAWLLPFLRVAGVTALILLLAFGPFLVVIAAKAARRRGRRRAKTPAARIAGGWEEYRDAALDAGRDAPRAATRGEQAAVFATPAATTLAQDADRAVFSDASIDARVAGDYWRAVDIERRILRRERGFWRGAVSTVSLRSLLLPLAPEPGVRVRTTERGRRRAEPARPTS
ncbi:hypothetical protein JOD63_002285 [Microbacterium terrae]|uniref:Transglutaminase-like superfamily protein n=1 Tax=Microbacterium terrae TaxID=69369 RepID=A0A0M2H684_9MICO|nr:transglutaminase domain-containing protein [Microbacterium terrae]KJL39395.1 Transglutaminase-like superfamily protein [Microbacterium terrae]MBP1078317.1 hypothetical protein [Microbacterium terrae]GLJ97796.1 cysteine protease [Microbacterium terrae]